MSVSDPNIEAACRDLVMRAALAADRNRPAELAALFAPDGVLVRPGGPPLEGRDAIRRSYEQRPADRISRHMVTTIAIDVAGEREASAVTYVLVWSGSSQDAEGPQGRPATGFPLAGEFHDRFVRTDEGWRIARREARFVLHLR